MYSIYLNEMKRSEKFNGEMWNLEDLMGSQVKRAEK